MQDHIQELILDSKMAKQDRLEHKEFASRLAAIEAKLEDRYVSSISNALYKTYQQVNLDTF